MAQYLGTAEWIALLFGLYMMAAAVGMARDTSLVDKIMEALVSQPLLGLLAGIMTLALGGTVVGLHNDWSGPLSIAVSLIGWAALVEGVLLLAFRSAFVGFFAQFKFTATTIRAISVATFVAGALLVFGALA